MLQYPTIPSEDFYKIKSDPTYYLGYYPEKYWDWDTCMEIMALFDDPKSFFYGNSLGEFRWEILKKYLGTIKEVLLMPGVYPRLVAPPRIYEEVTLVEVPEPPPPPPILAISSITPVENSIYERIYSDGYVFRIEGQGFMDEEGVEVLVEVVKMYNYEFRHDPIYPGYPYMRVLSANLIEVYIPKWRTFSSFAAAGYHDLTLITFPTAEYPEGRQAVMTNAYYFWSYAINWLYDLSNKSKLLIVEGMEVDGYFKNYSWYGNFQFPYPVQEVQLENAETGELFTIPTEDWEIDGGSKINIIIRTEYA